MKTIELFEKVKNQEIKNGTIFEVFKGKEKIGEIGVMKTVATFHEFEGNIPPVDLWTGDYTVEEINE